MEYKYNNLVEHLSNQFQRSLELISTIYNFDNGDEFEIAICEVLRSFLPLKYGIARGFVINGEGNTCGDDIIIYDQQKFPTLRFLEKNRYDRKEQIPVEAVYAYIEAKNTLDEETIKKAIKQTADVKKICYSRFAYFIDNLPSGNHYFFSDKYNVNKAWEPVIKNPVYTMIISRNVRKNKKQLKDPNKINNFIIEQINASKNELDENGFYNPECIVAGISNIAVCGHYHFDSNGNKKDSIEITKFYTGKRPLSCYQVNVHESYAYGLALSHLMLGLNSIELGDMPWELIFNCGKMPNESDRIIALNDISDV